MKKIIMISVLIVAIVSIGLFTFMKSNPPLVSSIVEEGNQTLSREKGTDKQIIIIELRGEKDGSKWDCFSC